MRLRLLAISAALLLASTAWGADPSLSGDSVVPQYRIVRLRVNDLGPKDAVRWKITPLDAKTTKDEIDYSKSDGAISEWVAPPGKYSVEALIVRPTADGSFTITTLEKVVEIFQRIPIPVPVVPPVNPPGPPVVPVPPPAPVGLEDAALVERYKAAIAKDVGTTFPGGGTKASAAALASVYQTASDMMAGEDATQWPATVGEMFERLTSASRGKMIPALPYLSFTRDVSGNYLGAPLSTTALDKAARLGFAEKFRVAAASLKKASESP